MHKHNNSLSSMSLLQQLGIIILFVGVTVVVFFAVYLKGNVEDFVTNQCMSILQRSQESLVTNIKSGATGYSDLTYDSDVMHFVYNNDKMTVYYGTTLYNSDFLKGVTDLVKEHKEGLVESTYDSSLNRYYYRISSIDSRREVISMINIEYGVVIEKQLLSSVTNNMALIISLLFITLIAWVTTIITPLQQIRIYIDKVQKGDKEATLNVDRGDEIGAMAKELVSMRNELTAQDEMKEELIHNISHDLKTPIAIIKSYAESIRDGIYPYDSLDKSVDVIIENAERLDKKVHSLLFLNRLDYVMEQEKATDKSTNMRNLVKSVVVSFKMIRPQITIEQLLEKGIMFKGDEESWRVVISNLLDNALRYANSRIVIELQPYTITIYNDGETLTEDRMKKLFKPFEKGDQGKFGLGLSICYKVCNTYGYKIEAENMPNGVIFIITQKDIPQPVKKKRAVVVKSKDKESN